MMNEDEEEVLYNFLENTVLPFSIDDIMSGMAVSGKKKYKKLSIEIRDFLNDTALVFRIKNHIWLSRKGYFKDSQFIITPTRQELLNGILIPGHRCIPFANPFIMPHEYKFYWDDNLIPSTTTEASPEDLYPYYCIFGEEYAPQYIARDNPENEKAFLNSFADEPIEVSIHSLDMRAIYRKYSFVPGDSFCVQIRNWDECHFNLEKIKMGEWSDNQLNEWIKAAENGFKKSFKGIGPGNNTEEQIAFAYLYGGKRMMEVPALSLEEFLYEKTDSIDTVTFGIETRFWFVSREIPDLPEIVNFNYIHKKTIIEELLYEINIPISEYVVDSYICDAFFRREKDAEKVVKRIIPPVVDIDEAGLEFFTVYISDQMKSNEDLYMLYRDINLDNVRQRAIELHTAVIELSAKLMKGKTETAWLPRHTFIILSQIQTHAAAFLEDMSYLNSFPDLDIDVIDNSLDNMIDTFTDIKELISTSSDNFRRSNLTLIHGGVRNGQMWRIIQISISGADVWRRAIVSYDCTLNDLHKIIQVCMNWENNFDHNFYYEIPSGIIKLDIDTKINEIEFHGKKEIVYEYGTRWVVKIIILSSFQSEKNEVTRFVEGEGAPPPEHINGPRHFNKILYVIQNGSLTDKKSAQSELGNNYTDEVFDLVKINKKLHEELNN